jgi:hypothetical protein
MKLGSQSSKTYLKLIGNVEPSKHCHIVEEDWYTSPLGFPATTCCGDTSAWNWKSRDQYQCRLKV